MNLRIFYIISVLFLCSCAITDQQKIMYAKDYNFSIQTPPNSWKQVDIVKEMDKMIRIKLQGRRVSPEVEKIFLKNIASMPARQYKGFFAWRKGNDSQIMIGAKEHTDESKEKTYRDILYSQIDNRLNILLNNYKKAIESIDSEDEGVFQEAIEFASIEATIKCYNDAGKLSYTEKMVSYCLNTDSHIYLFSLGTVPNKIEKYRIVFEQVLNSFSYTKPDSIKKNKIVKPHVDYQGLVGKKKDDKKEGEACLNSGECGHLLYCIEHKCQKYSEKSPDLQKKCPDGYYFHEDWHSGKCFPEEIKCPEGYHYDKDKKKCSSDN